MVKIWNDCEYFFYGKSDFSSANYRDTLLEYIDSAELPEFLGGTLTDPDGNPRCPSKICQGGPVPANLYLKDITLSDQDLQTTTLPKSGEVDLEFTVSKGNLLR